MSSNFIKSVIWALGFFLFFALILPEFNSVLDARSSLGEKTELLQEKQSAQEKIRALKTQYQSRSGDVRRLGILLPSDKRTEYVLASIQNAAQAHGMQLRSLSFRQEGVVSSEATHQELEANLELSGAYDGLVGFLDILEQDLRIFDVTNLQATSDVNSSLLLIDLKFVTYRIL